MSEFPYAAPTDSPFRPPAIPGYPALDGAPLPLSSPDVARQLAGLGLHVVHYKTRAKYPTRDGWHREPCNEESLRQIPRDANLGLLLNDVVDVDFDCPEALRLAHHLPGGWLLRFGKSSTPNAHWLYRCRDGRSEGFKEAKHAAVPAKMLVELRSANGRGVQSLCYGVHPNGEQITFERGETPAQDVEFSLLFNIVTKIAAASLIVRQIERNPSLKCEDATAWLRHEAKSNEGFADAVVAFVAEAMRGVAK